MTTKRTPAITAEPVPTRRCIGNRTFGIEAHEAPTSDFPVQPSRRDGLGALCRTHWTEYTGALRRARREREAEGTTVPAHEHTLGASLVGEGQPVEAPPTRRRTSRSVEMPVGEAPEDPPAA
jgi:hypothetical protein